MINRIHILGASGSGTSTLARALSEKSDYIHFDTDDYFWKPTNPPFQYKREIKERQDLLRTDLENNEKWILSGSLCGWGDIFIPYFDLVIYLWIPEDLRIARLIEREKKRYGEKIELDGPMYNNHKEFINWASQYDVGDMSIRSKMLHQKWISELPCKVIKLEGILEIEEKVNRVLSFMNNFKR